MENFRNSPLGLSLADRFRKVVSPRQMVTQTFSDIQANLPTMKQVFDDQNENQVETRSEPQPDSNIQKKKIIPETSPQSPQTTPSAQQIEDAVRKLSKPELTKESSHVKVHSSDLSSRVGQIDQRNQALPNQRS